MASKLIEGEIVTRPIGRPPKLNPTQKLEVFNAFIDYISSNADPTIVGFVSRDKVALQYMVSNDNLYDWDEFSELRKLAVKKQEAYLVDGATTNKLNATFAIFRLKQPQHGWTDKQEIDQNVNVVQPILGGMAKAELDEGDEDTKA